MDEAPGPLIPPEILESCPLCSPSGFVAHRAPLTRQAWQLFCERIVHASAIAAQSWLASRLRNLHAALVEHVHPCVHLGMVLRKAQPLFVGLAQVPLLAHQFAE